MVLGENSRSYDHFFHVTPRRKHLMVAIKPTQYLAHIDISELVIVDPELAVFYSLEDRELIILNPDGKTITVIQK